MNFGDIFEMKVENWEAYFSNRSNTREISYHGGGTAFGYFKVGIWDQRFTPEEMLAVYPEMVQAALNKWSEWSAIEREPFEYCPIEEVTSMAFGKEWKFYEHLRPYYERLWLESPRPHGEPLRRMAINSQGRIPVSRAQLGLLSQVEGWEYLAVRIAFFKGWTNDAIEMAEHLNQKNFTIWNIEDLVELGLPKEKGIRLLRHFHADDELSDKIIADWEKE